MQNFSAEFETPEQYIIDITYKIWEARGIGRIRDWYAADCPVRTPHGVSDNVAAVISSTLSALHEFPDRQLLAEDIIIGDKANGFYSSHRVRSTATHLGKVAIAQMRALHCHAFGQWQLWRGHPASPHDAHHCRLSLPR
ncbi:MAG: hypothetical protein R3E79_02980 [Caldilineaceae bacterium]